MTDLYYCADGNKRFAEIAIAAGFLYGAQLPRKVYFQPSFVDQDWKNPNRERYMTALAQYRPDVASVLDWTPDVALSDVLEWAEEAAQFVETVMIIPKVIGGVRRIPTAIAGKTVRLGYSVPTRFGGTIVPTWEFERRPVLLLGGSPHRQMSLTARLNVVSVDSNYIQREAIRNVQFWTMKDLARKPERWVTLEEADGEKWGDDAPYEAFRRSCENVMKAWRRLLSKEPLADLPLFA